MVFVLFFMAGFLPIAAGESLPRPDISIAAATEEGQKLLVATVELGGKPLQGAQVAFFVRRLFGLISLGVDETIEDGTAAVPFPEKLPGGTSGELEVVVEVAGSPSYAADRKVLIVEGGLQAVKKEESFPRALWAPHAPIPLIVTIIGLLAIVWSAYTFVFVQLFKIYKEGTR